MGQVKFGSGAAFLTTYKACVQREASPNLTEQLRRAANQTGTAARRQRANQNAFLSSYAVIRSYV